VFVVLPEEDKSKHFMVSLLVQQMYREILAVADETGGKLDNRVMFFLDEFGTIPKIESAEMMFSASRSRRMSIVAIIQSFAQLQKSYGKEGCEIITDNTQLTIFGGFAPNSESAQLLSKALGTKTVQSGSVSRNKNDPSQSLQMIERPLLTPDELKDLPKGTFIVMKTGFYPMKVHLQLFFKWGIQFEEKPFFVPDKGNHTVAYAKKKVLEDAITSHYGYSKPAGSEDIPQQYIRRTNKTANTAQGFHNPSANPMKKIPINTNRNTDDTDDDSDDGTQPKENNATPEEYAEHIKERAESEEAPAHV
jgi:type IV secretion system protein VirD4